MSHVVCIFHHPVYGVGLNISPCLLPLPRPKMKVVDVIFNVNRIDFLGSEWYSYTTTMQQHINNSVLQFFNAKISNSR